MKEVKASNNCQQQWQGCQIDPATITLRPAEAVLCFSSSSTLDAVIVTYAQTTAAVAFTARKSVLLPVALLVCLSIDNTIFQMNTVPLKFTNAKEKPGLRSSS